MARSPHPVTSISRDELRHLRRALVRYCAARLPPDGHISADDVAQEILVGLLRALPSYRGDVSGFRPFVFGIARHKVTDVLRARYRDRSMPVSELPDVTDGTELPEQRVLDGERQAQVAELLATLPPVQREVLRLRVGAGLSATETAHRISRTASSVRVIQFRALARLRTELDARPRPDAA